MGKKKKAYKLLFEDEHLILLNKAPKVLSIPDRFTPEKPNLFQMLNERYGKVFVVHRLDRETSGVMCFAKTEEAHKHLSQQFEKRTVQKTYLALCEGVFLNKEGEVDLGIAPHPSISGKMITSNKGKSALTTYKVREEFKAFTLVEARIHTGRTHQIRVHLQALGHPLAVDALYNKRKALYLSEFKRKHVPPGRDKVEKPLLSRHSLHAWRLELLHPSGEEALEFEAPLPKDFKASLNQLRKWNT